MASPLRYPASGQQERAHPAAPPARLAVADRGTGVGERSPFGRALQGRSEPGRSLTGSEPITALWNWPAPRVMALADRRSPGLMANDRTMFASENRGRSSAENVRGGFLPQTLKDGQGGVVARSAVERSRNGGALGSFRQSISGEKGEAFKALSLCFHAIPDAKPLRILLELLEARLAPIRHAAPDGARSVAVRRPGRRAGAARGSQPSVPHGSASGVP